MTATATTDPDYWADDYYESRVVASLTSSNGDYLSSALTDTWDAGYASVTMQITGTTPGAVYSLRTLHGFIMDIADPSYGCECYFDDYFNYGFYQNQGIDTQNGYNFLGNGPLVVRHYSSMILGYTNASITTPPKLASISPPRGVVAGTTHVTLTGDGFNSSAIINAGSDITVSNQSVNSATSITADFSVATNASGGNKSISVTVNGNSGSVNFFVQIPTSLLLYMGSKVTYNGGPDFGIVTWPTSAR